jgi:hypothetical protein
VPKPRWLPQPPRLSAQGSKTVQRRRLVRGPHRVVVGLLDALQEGLAAQGWQSHTAFVERLPRPRRQHGAAMGRRGTPLGQDEEGLCQQRAVSHVYEKFCWPHARVRQPLPQPVHTHGAGSATRGQPRTPAMAAGVTDHGGTRRAVRRCRVPPWPLAQQGYGPGREEDRQEERGEGRPQRRNTGGRRR